MSAFWRRVWRGWCIAVFAHDPEPEAFDMRMASIWRRKVDILQGRVCELEAALVLLSDDAEDMQRRVTAALYRAGDADEP